ncbi:hypothetical protein EDB80DRAFT_674808 [Ilyonectria destructans]|nr:hypothetical protein EDB80DRAFT_674808 [Ilyonectria destructans]
MLCIPSLSSSRGSPPGRGAQVVGRDWACSHVAMGPIPPAQFGATCPKGLALLLAGVMSMLLCCPSEEPYTPYCVLTPTLSLSRRRQGSRIWPNATWRPHTPILLSLLIPPRPPLPRPAATHWSLVTHSTAILVSATAAAAATAAATPTAPVSAGSLATSLSVSGLEI